MENSHDSNTSTSGTGPSVEFEDYRVQKVYGILCHEDAPPKGEHWEGYVARLIVDALCLDVSAFKRIGWTVTPDGGGFAYEATCSEREAAAAGYNVPVYCKIKPTEEYKLIGYCAAMLSSDGKVFARTDVSSKEDAIKVAKSWHTEYVTPAIIPVFTGKPEIL